MAVLPTPGSPTKMGLFLRRRQSTWMVRWSSLSRPMSGSILPSAARSMRLTAKAASGSFRAWAVSVCAASSSSPAGTAPPAPVASSFEMPCAR
jgi:hypothetical protein